MITTRFSSLPHSLTRVRSRRSALASLLGGKLGVLSLTDMDAKKRKKGKHGKKKHKDGNHPTPPPATTFETAGGHGGAGGGGGIGFGLLGVLLVPGGGSSGTGRVTITFAAA